MKKSELKALIKQCLVEILNEGLQGSLQTQSGNLGGLQQEHRQTTTKAVPRNPRTQALHNEAIREIVGHATKDPTMAAIFTETAATTLTLQNDAERTGRSSVVAPPGSDRAQHAIANVAPEELFGDDVANKWAALAFMDK